MSGAVMPNKLEKIWKMKSDIVKLLLGKKVSAQQPQNEMQTCVPSQSTKCDANTIAAKLLAAKLSELSRNFSWQQLLTSVIEKSSEFHTQLTKFASFYSLMSWESSQRKRSNDNMLKSTKNNHNYLFCYSFSVMSRAAVVFVFYSRPQLSFNWTNSRRFFILIL